jgi:hypothetical protein
MTKTLFGYPVVMSDDVQAPAEGDIVLDTWDARARTMIKEQADVIRQEMSEHSSLYGVTMDMDDVDMLIVAAYVLGAGPQYVRSNEVKT